MSEYRIEIISGREIVDNEKKNKAYLRATSVCVYAMHKLTLTYGKFVPLRSKRLGSFPRAWPTLLLLSSRYSCGFIKSLNREIVVDTR